jgi:hypothetical protein
MPPFLRSALPLVIGLLVGGVGAMLFQQSLPGAVGSPEERAAKLEIELRQVKNRLAAIEAEDAPERARSGMVRDAQGRLRPARTLGDGARRIAEDIREGRPVSPEDIFNASKPLMRDLAPLFDRMRVRQMRETIDSMSGELARKYDLTPQQQAELRQWFHGQANEEARRWSTLVADERTRLEDLIRASHDVQPDAGIEKFMEGVLSGEKLTAFKTERLNERAQRVQADADRKVQRLDAIVGLDETQRDQVFGIVARGSPEYDRAMVLEGARGEIGATPAGDSRAALLSVLRPEQRMKYEAERQRRWARAQEDMQAIGLTLPADWEMLDHTDLP